MSDSGPAPTCRRDDGGRCRGDTGGGDRAAGAALCRPVRGRVRAARPGRGTPVSDDRERRARLAFLADWVVVRTRFLDDLVLDACARRMSPGRDPRGRSRRPGLPAGAGRTSSASSRSTSPRCWSFKEQVVRAEGWRPTCERITVPADLSGDWGRPLVEAGFDAGRAGRLAGRRTARLLVAAGERRPHRPRGRAVRADKPAGPHPGQSQRLRSWREAHPDGTGAAGDYVALWRSAGPEQAEGVARVPRLARARSSTPPSGRPATAGLSDRGPGTPTAPASSTPNALTLSA